VGQSMNSVAFILPDTARTDESRLMGRRALEMVRRALGSDILKVWARSMVPSGDSHYLVLWFVFLSSYSF
jgi:hypothetical protein